MVWSHKNKMHWTNGDISGVILHVKPKGNQWLFVAADIVTKAILVKSTHSHPIEAINAAHKFKETIDVVQEEATKSSRVASAEQASGAI